MKIAIVQGFIEFTEPFIHENYSMSAKEFYSPFSKNTKAWAKRMGYDYYFFEDQKLWPKKLRDNPDNFLNGYLLKTQLNTYRHWWLKSVIPNYDLVCWIDSDVGILGNPDVLSIIDPNKFNVATWRNTYQYQSFSCEVTNNWFMCMNSERCNHFTDWVESVLTDKSARSDLLITLRMIRGKIGDESLMACYRAEGNEHHLNLIDLPHDSLKNAVTDEEVVESLKQDVMIHFSGANKLRMGKIFKTYVIYMKYLHVSKKRDAKIRHIITKCTNEELDELYNTTTNKLKELL